MKGNMAMRNSTIGMNPVVKFRIVATWYTHREKIGFVVNSNKNFICL